MSRERPILFSGPMVRAILGGSKTQTRRVMKRPEIYGCPTGDCPHWAEAECAAAMLESCPYGKPGDRLWVRETWRTEGLAETAYYRADEEWHVGAGWKPSIHMRRSLSRITLEITKIRAELLQEISRSDCRAEGIIVPADVAMREGFRLLWMRIHGQKAWVENPWVWVIEFRRIKP